MINKEPEKIKTMFNKIAKNYDLLNNIISFFTHYQVKKIAVKSLNIIPNSKVLDLCCGTGDLGRIAKKLTSSCEVTGVDFSKNMTNIAAKKNPNIQYLEQDATNLNFENNSFDYVLMGFGLRNIQDRKSALKEVYRLLKKDGAFLHLDFGAKNFLNKIYDNIISVLTRIFFKNKESYLYLLKSKNEFPAPNILAEEFKDIGFKVKTIKYCCFNLISFQICTKN